MAKRRCWAEVLGDCHGAISGEHLVSRGLFSGDTVAVAGPAWNVTEPKTIGLKALTANILCEKHNNEDASTLDAAAISALEALNGAFDLHLQREMQLRAVGDAWLGWAPTTFVVDGSLFERWFVKTLLNFGNVRGAPTTLSTGESLGERPPRWLVEAAFGYTPLREPMGLYAVARVGQDLARLDRFRLMMITGRASGRLGGARFDFRGWRFLLWLSEESPLEISSDVSDEQSVRGSDLIRRPKTFHFTVTDHSRPGSANPRASHCVEFQWS